MEENHNSNLKQNLGIRLTYRTQITMNPGFWRLAFFLLSNVGFPKAADQCCEGEHSVSDNVSQGTRLQNS